MRRIIVAAMVAVLPGLGIAQADAPLQPAVSAEQAETITILLKQLEEDKYGSEDDSAKKRLVAIGEPVVRRIAPMLTLTLREEDTYYYGALVRVVAAIPGEESCRILLRELDQISDPKAVLTNLYGVPIVERLGVSLYRPAIPRLTELAREQKSELSCHARVALNVMGAPVPAPPKPYYTWAADAETDSTQPGYAEARQAVENVLANAFRPGHSPTLIQRLNFTDGEWVAIGNTPQDCGWNVKLSPDGADYFKVTASYYCAPLWAGGYEGRMVRREGVWLLIQWKRTWIS